jgi:hypothetical protein
VLAVRLVGAVAGCVCVSAGRPASFLGKGTRLLVAPAARRGSGGQRGAQELAYATSPRLALERMRCCRRWRQEKEARGRLGSRETNAASLKRRLSKATVAGMSASLIREDACFLFRRVPRTPVAIARQAI